MLELSSRLEDLTARSGREFAAFTDSEAAQPAIAGGWSRKQVLGHLIDSASNNHQRFVRALLQDELRWPAYDQAGCVRVQHFQDASWNNLVRLWTSFNSLLAHVLAHVPDAKRKTRCIIGDGAAMTLEELAEDYLVHMEHHLDQIRSRT
jgi:DinB superfamily